MYARKLRETSILKLAETCMEMKVMKYTDYHGIPKFCHPARLPFKFKSAKAKVVLQKIMFSSTWFILYCY